MDTVVLKDPSVHPTDEIVFSHIGDKKILWEQLNNHISTERKDMSGEWRYYNDGKSWLFRGLKKDKVIFWTAVMEGYFRVTFYLSSKAESLVAESNLPEKIKTDFEATRGAKFRSITLLMESEEDIENLKKLIEIKLKVK
ncbi:MAG TPA: DUF3788 family protein [Bacteroidales bacterium]|nr:DUF3788 family protein [Bacteroidales bacterium]